MLKTYTILELDCKQISVRKGAMKYLLVDELGNKRNVSAIAKLGIDKKIRSLQAIQFREKPLIEALSNAQLNDTFDVDFTHFNEQNPRVTSDRNRAAEEKQLNDLNDAQSLSFVNSFIENKILLVQILGVVGLMLGLYISFKLVSG